ncbi:MAG: ribonuclease E/G [Eubacteriales bacterium]
MKARQIVIAMSPKGLCMAHAENSRVTELQVTPLSKQEPEIGDIYIGRVQKIVPSLNAAFIEVIPQKPCYYDIKKNLNPIFTHKIGKKPICEAEQLIVQIEKEAVKTKPMTVTSNINFTGNYVVVATGDKTIGVSSKIQDENRKRLQKLLAEYQSEEYGIIARTNAMTASEEMIRSELESLILECKNLVQKANTRTTFTCLKKASAPYIAFIRTMYHEDVEKIQVENQEVYDEIVSCFSKIQPAIVEKLELYTDKNYDLNKLYSLDKVIENATRKKVWMKSGAYLVIEPTEALTVVDVNSGKCVIKKDKEELYFKINCEAAIEVAMQMRLRNLSGIIIIDFINLKDAKKMREVLKILKEHLQNDKIPTKLIGVTKLQLVEITRMKKRQSLQESLNV